MSARLKLKKLKLQTKFILDNCRRREAEAHHEVLRCHKLLQENIIKVGAVADVYPMQTMRGAANQLDYNVHKITDAIVRKYTEQLAEYVRDALISNYMFNDFSRIQCSLLAPALTEDHVKVYVTEKYK